MNNEHNDKLEQRIRFVAKHYNEGRLDEDKAWKRFAADHQIVHRGFLHRYWMGIAATLLVLVGLGTFFMQKQEKADWVAITTGPGQTKEVYLPDSTLISLAGNSKIRYDRKIYGKEGRAVEMSGKAFFQVMRNEARPFFVKTEWTEVTVLGTSFQIDEQGKITEVHVATGKIRFTAGAGKKEKEVILTAGMSAQYSMDKKDITVMDEEDNNYLSWKTGQLRFHDTPLDRVIEDLNAYYQVKIRNRGTSGDGVKLTATFNGLPLEEVLMVVNQTLDTRLVVDPIK